MDIRYQISELDWSFAKRIWMIITELKQDVQRAIPSCSYLFVPPILERHASAVQYSSDSRHTIIHTILEKGIETSPMVRLLMVASLSTSCPSNEGRSFDYIGWCH
ncbi:unnamed protein product [Haemonchus placei]|uniref:Ovule protein n=1 Tax=Haemonchus placei TaxID=6290 RepID=A0A0N4WTE8_HAEPC|nr:unnamed protein product [Haemonchus placei]